MGRRGVLLSLGGSLLGSGVAQWGLGVRVVWFGGPIWGIVMIECVAQLLRSELGRGIQVLWWICTDHIGTS